MHSELVKVAKKIDHMLSDIISLQQEYVAKICSTCEDPCCGKVQYLFDEKDRIFAMVCYGQDMFRKKVKGRDGCSFLTPKGCRLQLKERPFMCHRYLCARLKDEMYAQNPEVLQILDEKFRIIDDLRGHLWRLYLETLRPSVNSRNRNVDSFFQSGS